MILNMELEFILNKSFLALAISKWAFLSVFFDNPDILIHWTNCEQARKPGVTQPSTLVDYTNVMNTHNSVSGVI